MSATSQKLHIQKPTTPEKGRCGSFHWISSSSRSTLRFLFPEQDKRAITAPNPSVWQTFSQILNAPATLRKITEEVWRTWAASLAMCKVLESDHNTKETKQTLQCWRSSFMPRMIGKEGSCSIKRKCFIYLLSLTETTNSTSLQCFGN